MANDRLVKLTEADQAEERENVNTKKKIIWL